MPPLPFSISSLFKEHPIPNAGAILTIYAIVVDGVPNVTNEEDEEDVVVGGATAGDSGLDLLFLSKLPSLDEKKLVTGAGDNDDIRRRLVAGGMIRVRQNAARAKEIDVDCAIVVAPSSSSRKPRFR